MRCGGDGVFLTGGMGGGRGRGGRRGVKRGMGWGSQLKWRASSPLPRVVRHLQGSLVNLSIEGFSNIWFCAITVPKH